MEETLFQRDRVFVNKFIYGIRIPATIVDVEIFLDKRIPTIYHLPKIRNPQRGDVVVLTPPISSGKKDFIKRVIALGGETVEVKDKTVFINGRILNEPYKYCSKTDIRPGERDNLPPFTIPEGSLFVMGDNRDKSYDSRMFGPVPIENIRGKAVFIYWPLTRWNTL